MVLSRRRVSSVALLLLLGLVTSACGTPSPSNGPTALIPVRYQMSWLPQAEFAGLYVAQTKGFFRDAGLDVTLIPGGPNVTAAKEIATGVADIGEADPGQVLAGRENGVPLVNVFQLHQTSDTLYVAKKKTGIAVLRDVIGKKVGLWFGGAEFEFVAMLKSQGIDPQKVDMFSQGFTVVPWLQDQYQVMEVTPWNEFQQVLQKYPLSDLTVFKPADFKSAVLGAAVVVTQDYAAQHADTLQRFLNALARGWAWSVENPDEAAAIVVAQASGLDLDFQKHEMRGMVDVICGGDTKNPSRGMGYLNPDAFATDQTILKDSKQIQGTLPLASSYMAKFWNQVPSAYKHPSCAAGSGAA